MFYNLYRNIIAIIKFTAFLSLIIIILLVSPFTYFLSIKIHRKLLVFFSLCTCFILRIKVGGRKLKSFNGEGLFLVSNHCSYLDIPVIGKKILVRFTPKSEIKSWPILGWLTNVSMPVYIERKGNKALEQKEKIENVIKSGDNIMIFPEGTTNNGREVKDFKSSLFSVVIGSDIKLQPIAITYKGFNGIPINESNIDKIAWHGDMTLMPHLWDIMKSNGIKAEIEYLKQINAKDFNDRKLLAKTCGNAIRKAVKNV